jgi:hypothetical protein
MSKRRRKKKQTRRNEERSAQRDFMKAMTNISKKRESVSVDGMWVWGYVTDDNMFIAPPVLNARLFPVGLPVYTEEVMVERKVEGEREISKKIPLPAGQSVHHYQLGKDLDFEIYAKAGLHMFRKSLSTFKLEGIKGAAENEFNNGLLFIDPPLLKVDDSILMLLYKRRKLRLLACVKEWNMAEVLAWNT